MMTLVYAYMATYFALLSSLLARAAVLANYGHGE
jgi:hypothetical protein